MQNSVSTVSSPYTNNLQIVALQIVHAKAILKAAFCIKQIQSGFILQSQ